MNAIAAERAAPKRPGLFRRLARRVCAARMEYVWREIEYHRDFLDAVGGRIDAVQPSAVGEPEFAVTFESLQSWGLELAAVESIANDPFGELTHICPSQEGRSENAMPGSLTPETGPRVELAA